MPWHERNVDPVDIARLNAVNGRNSALVPDKKKKAATNAATNEKTKPTHLPGGRVGTIYIEGFVTF